MFREILSAIGAFFLDFIETALVALIIFVFVYLFLFQPHQVKGNSMVDSFHDGEYLLTNKFVYRINQPKLDDVIIFKAPTNEDYDYIKRIIGLPGDTVELLKGRVLVNGRVINEDKYVAAGTLTNPGFYLDDGKIYKVPENEYFVMGDNRPHSSDSRDWGTVPKKNIIGKAWLRYWPPNEFGLVTGGNLFNSL